MGAMVKVVCESCRAQWDCRRGCGIQQGLLENVAPLFPEKTEGVLMEYARRNENAAFDFGFYPAVCVSCADIVSVPVLRLEDGEAPYIGPCPGCGKKARPIRELERGHCPRCGESALKEVETGRWD